MVYAQPNFDFLLGFKAYNIISLYFTIKQSLESRIKKASPVNKQ